MTTRYLVTALVVAIIAIHVGTHEVDACCDKGDKGKRGRSENECPCECYNPGCRPPSYGQCCDRGYGDYYGGGGKKGKHQSGYNKQGYGQQGYSGCNCHHDDYQPCCCCEQEYGGYEDKKGGKFWNKDKGKDKEKDKGKDKDKDKGKRDRGNDCCCCCCNDQQYRRHGDRSSCRCHDRSRDRSCDRSYNRPCDHCQDRSYDQCHDDSYDECYEDECCGEVQSIVVKNGPAIIQTVIVDEDIYARYCDGSYESGNPLQKVCLNDEAGCANIGAIGGSPTPCSFSNYQYPAYRVVKKEPYSRRPCGRYYTPFPMPYY